MTQESKIVFDISDISNIRVVCLDPGCLGEIMCPLGSKYRIPRECPYCETQWVTNGSDTAEMQLVKALRNVQLQSNSRTKLRFEIQTSRGSEEARP